MAHEKSTVCYVIHSGSDVDSIITLMEEYSLVLVSLYVYVLTVYFDTLESTLYITGFSKKPESNFTALFEERKLTY